MIFHIALKDLLIVFRDKKALAVMVAMPILIILILGSAFSNSFERQISIDKFEVAVVDKDQGEIAKALIQQVLVKGAGGMFNTRVVEEAKAESLLEDKKVSSVIYIPEKFSSDIQQGKPVKLEIQSLSGDKYQSMIVESTVNSYFAQPESLKSAGISAVAEAAHEKNLKFDFMALEQKLQSRFVNFKTDEQEKNKSLSAIQYYSAGMLLMFILFGANQGAKLLIEERENKTLGRVMISSATRPTIVVGKFLGLMVICLAQALILIAFTAMFYGVAWGGSFLGVAAVTLSSVFAGAALFMFVAAISKTAKAADGFSQVFIQLFTILGGGMIPIYIMPQVMQTIAKATVNWWGMKGFTDLMSGVNAVYTYCVILIAMGIVYLVIGTTKFKAE